MSTFEIRERNIAVGPFSGAGPHQVHTHTTIPTSARAGVGVRFLIEDLDTGLVLYQGTFGLTIHGAHLLTASPITELFAETGWSGNVSISSAIVSAEPVTDVTIPAGYDVRIIYQVEGVAWLTS